MTAVLVAASIALGLAAVLTLFGGLDYPRGDVPAWPFLIGAVVLTFLAVLAGMLA